MTYLLVLVTSSLVRTLHPAAHLYSDADEAVSAAQSIMARTSLGAYVIVLDEETDWS